MKLARGRARSGAGWGSVANGRELAVFDGGKVHGGWLGWRLLIEVELGEGRVWPGVSVFGNKTSVLGASFPNSV